MKFKRDHHQRIAQILSLLDAEYLRENACWFGGGTAIVLQHNEYRESLDIDFLVSSREGYRELRSKLTGENGVLALMPSDQIIVTQARDVRADQYGIRTSLVVNDSAIKFEIVLEARIEFESPPRMQRIGGISTLSQTDLIASKLLANSDRGTDNSTFSRDLLDIAMAMPDKVTFKKALEKSQAAYGDAILSSMTTAMDHLTDTEGRLDRCLRALKFSVPKAVVWKNLLSIRKQLVD